MKRIINILLLLLFVQTITFAQGVGVDSVQVVNALADTCFNNTIADSVKLKSVPFETITREGTKYYAVTSDGHKEEITSMINGKTRALVQDGEGHELVLDKDGNVMGVEEYKKCGGSAKLLSEHNAHRDSTMATSGNVKFSKVKDENYGFDEWRGADYDKDVYDNFNGYRPTYIGAQKQSNIKVAANQTKGIRFITERGVPIIAKNDTLNLTIGTTGKQAVYAYSDSTLVGKLCIQAYDQKEVKVHVVRVNNAKMPSADKLQSELNEIFSQAVVKLKLDELEPITIKLDHHFKHGGTRRLRAYNDDQRKVVDELKNRAEYNADDFYLFFVDDIERLDDEGKPTSDIIGGYMPVGWHFGFIYNNPKIAYIAHELGHGTLAMHHTFSDETETFSAPKESTDNMMDYKGGTLLNHKQWQWAHENHGREWFEEESEGEISIQDIYVKAISSWNEVSQYISTTYNDVKNEIVSSYNDIKNEVVNSYNEATEYVVASTDEAAIASLVETAEFIEPNVSKMSEQEKQQAFDNNADKTVAVLLYEFATGEGEAIRIFTSLKPNSFARSFLDGREFLGRNVLLEVRAKIYKEFEKQKLTYDSFEKNGITIKLEFSPDQTKTLIESIMKHVCTNLSQLFIGGAIVKIRATNEHNWVLVEIINQTSRKSLMLHVADNYNRERGKTIPLSTIEQRIVFKLEIDTNKLYKQ